LDVLERMLCEEVEERLGPAPLRRGNQILAFAFEPLVPGSREIEPKRAARFYFGDETSRVELAIAGDGSEDEQLAALPDKRLDRLKTNCFEGRVRPKHKLYK